LVLEFRVLLIWREDTGPGAWTKVDLTNYLELCDLGLELFRCAPFPQGLPDAKVEVVTPGEPADFFVAGPAWVVSDRMRELLESFRVAAEFIPVRLTWKGRAYQERRFYLVNLLDVVECFDYRRSRYKRTPRGVHEIEELVLDDAKAAGRHLFTVGPLPSPEPNPAAVRGVIRCASEELATAVLRAGMSGAEFTLPKDRQVRPAAWAPAS
jgi:Immunity protein family (Imm11)